MAEQNFFLENVDFEDILEDARRDGKAISIARSVELTLESPYSDGPISLNAMWVTLRSRSSSFSSGISGIVDDFEDGFAFRLTSVAAFEEGNNGVGVKLTGINSDVYSEDDELFLVFEYHKYLEKIINFDYPIRLKSENPITDNRVWSKPVLKLDNFVMVDSIEIVPEPVPELGTILGLGVVAALCIAVGWALPTNLAMLRRRSPMEERDMLQRFTPARPTTFAKVYRKDNDNFIDKCTEQLKIATEYFSLAILPELSDAEADRLEEILELAQFDDNLSSLINKIDCFVLEELKCFEPDELDRDKNQIARIEEFIASESQHDDSQVGTPENEGLAFSAWPRIAELSDDVNLALFLASNLDNYAPEALAATQQWVVNVRSEQSSSELAALLGAIELGETGHIANTYIWEFPEDADPKEVALQLSSRVEVEFAYPIVPLQL